MMGAAMMGRRRPGRDARRARAVGSPLHLAAAWARLTPLQLQRPAVDPPPQLLAPAPAAEPGTAGGPGTPGCRSIGSRLIVREGLGLSVHGTVVATYPSHYMAPLPYAGGSDSFSPLKLSFHKLSFHIPARIYALLDTIFRARCSLSSSAAQVIKAQCRICDRSRATLLPYRVAPR
jgi:hypothetical protein